LYLAIVVQVIGVATLIYVQGGWVRYRYTVRALNEACSWVVKVVIKEVRATCVRYDAGFEFQARRLEHNVIVLPPQLSYNSLLL
jgi:hypothetical protein